MEVHVSLGPARATDTEAAVVLGHLSAPVIVQVEQAGRWYDGFCRRQHDHASASQRLSESEAKKEAESDSEDEDDSPYTSIGSGDWKNQDHYALLGLAQLRFQATEDDIKKAYKKMVLKYHPDKKAGGEATEEDRAKMDAHFNCIKKAYDLLSNPDKRKLYDSIDDVDDSVPAAPKDPADFFRVFGPVFARNAKWFEKQPAPLLGDDDMPFEKVQEMYDFWYNTPTWREFGYHDEEDPNSAESREEKRWIEKQNKAARRRKKKDEHARMLKLIDAAYAADPRIKRFREQEKKAKQDKKKQKEEEAKREEQRRIAQAQAEAAAKQQAAAAIAEEEKQKAEHAKKVRKSFVKACRRHGVCEDKEDGAASSASSSAPVSRENVDMLKATLALERLEEMTALDPAALLEHVQKELEAIRLKKEEEAAMNRPWTKQEQKALEDALRTVAKDAADRWDQIAAKVGRSRKECVARVKECAAKVKQQQQDKDVPKAPDAWTKEELQVLVKAASKVYPPGTQGDRWQLIAEYVKTHAHTEWLRNPKDVVAQVAAMKNVSSSLQQRTGTHAAGSESLKKGKDRTVPEESVPSQRY